MQLRELHLCVHLVFSLYCDFWDLVASKSSGDSQINRISVIFTLIPSFSNTVFNILTHLCSIIRVDVGTEKGKKGLWINLCPFRVPLMWKKFHKFFFRCFRNTHRYKISHLTTDDGVNQWLVKARLSKIKDFVLKNQKFCIHYGFPYTFLVSGWYKNLLIEI